jgi:hypothetical protein
MALSCETLDAKLAGQVLRALGPGVDHAAFGWDSGDIYEWPI